MSNIPAVELLMNKADSELVAKAMDDESIIRETAEGYAATIEPEDASELADKIEEMGAAELADTIRSATLDALHDWNNNGRFDR